MKFQWIYSFPTTEVITNKYFLVEISKKKKFLVKKQKYDKTNRNFLFPEEKLIKPKFPYKHEQNFKKDLLILEKTEHNTIDSN